MNKPETRSAFDSARLIDDMKAKCESLAKEEQKHRDAINTMRRELTRICKRRRAAKVALDDERARLADLMET